MVALIRNISLLLLCPILSSGSVLMDRSGRWSLSSVPSGSSKGLVVIVSSPGSPSCLGGAASLEGGDNSILTASSGSQLVCRGAALGGTSQAERTSLSTCSLVAGCLVLDGLTAGDAADLKNSRHARTLTALFRARVLLETDDRVKKQGLVLAVLQSEDVDTQAMAAQVSMLYQAAAAERKGAKSFEDSYELDIVLVGPGGASSSEILPTAAQRAQSVVTSNDDDSEESSTGTLASALSAAHSKVLQSGLSSVGLDTPLVAQAFVTTAQVFQTQSRRVRARVAAWKARAARGLWDDQFGAQATRLLETVLGSFDAETLGAAGLPQVSIYRQELRTQLASLLESATEEAFEAQVSNLEKATLKRFQTLLLKTVDESAETVIETNAAVMRNQALVFETVMEDLQVPALGLSKEKATREFSAKLNDSLMSFPDSPAAKLKRAQKIKNVVKKDKKPSERSIDFGLDIVAMLRPDGFGSLQGFAGYQLGGNSITFGSTMTPMIHK